MKNRLLLLLALAVVACGRKASLVIPEIPDYTLPANWYHLDRGTGADLFYISSTEVADRALKDGRVRHFASVTDSADRAALLAEYNGVDRLLSDGKLNFYGPYYRQMTLETYLSQEDVRSRVAVPLQDIHAAFDYYMAHENKGKPFILAGFSQGAQMTLELLKAMPDSVYSRMVAAYIIGWPVTPEDRKAAKSRIVPAEGAADTGVTVCYQSVRSPSDANQVINGTSCIGINPVNWCTDTTSAVFCDSLTVRLDPATHYLLVSGYESTDYVRPPYFQEGNYHTFEIRWYADCLRRNMQERLSHFEQHAADVVTGGTGH